MHNPQTTESAQKCILLFFWVIHDEISKVHITRSIYYYIYRSIYIIFRNLIHYNLHVNREESRENSFHIVGTNLHKNLHLGNLCVLFYFKHFTR